MTESRSGLAEARGKAEAFHMLGSLYESGRTVDHDYQKAAHMYAAVPAASATPMTQATALVR